MTSADMESIIEEVEHSLVVEHMTTTNEVKENLRRVDGELIYKELIDQYVVRAKRLATPTAV